MVSYCNKQLKKLEDSLQLIKDKKAKLIAVTPEKTEYISKTIEKTKASYSLLYDKEMKIMKAYAVAFEVDERTVSRYKNADIDLAAANGQKDKVYLPVPAVYIINKEGTIVYRYFDADYKKQPAVKDILENLR
jgi:Peroxiredoxin